MFCLRYITQSFVCLFLTCVAVEMCKVSKTGAGACIHVGRGSEDVSTQITEEVKPLVMELLLMGLSTAHHWRLVETRDGLKKRTAGMCCAACINMFTVYMVHDQPSTLKKPSCPVSCSTLAIIDVQANIDGNDYTFIIFVFVYLSKAHLIGWSVLVEV